MPIQPENDEAVEFLERWCPLGPWTITAIAVNQQSIETKCFKKKKDIIPWLEKRNGKKNLYFNVNPTIEPMNKKAAENDLSLLCWLHVDIDPRAGEDFGEERERTFEIAHKPPEGIPKPTVIIDSGGGYQLFWRLSDPVELNGDRSIIEKLKLYNKQLEIVLGGDNCHSLDHIMRLPGTVNIPNKRKVAKGRQKAMASVVRFGDETFSLSQFKASPNQLSNGLADTSTEKVIHAIRVKDMNELDTHAKSKIPDWCKVVIVQGNDPDNPEKHPSRSEWLFSVCCELVRCGVSDEVIFGIITDPDLGISESVRDKKSNATAYAKKQIKSARENAIDPMLMKFNKKHAVIGDTGGRCRIISEIYDSALDRTRISRQTFQDFTNRYSNQYVKVEDKVMSAGKWWLAHPKRRQYETIIFSPGKEMNGAYNLWQGFAFDAAPGNCDLYLDHILKNVCAGREEYSEYILNWMARTVQKPDKPGETAIVLRGIQGTGKSFMAKIFGTLFGRHFVPVSDSKHIVGSFNAHLRDCVVLFGDEAFYAGDVKHESILKMLVTEETMVTEVKGVDAEITNNCTHIILASNKQWVIPAGSNERRFLVLDVLDTHQQDIPYFTKIKQQMNNGGFEALLHFLMNRDISNFNVRIVPKTAALHEQKLLSLTSISEWWLTKLSDGRLLKNHITWDETVYRDALVNDYLEYAKNVGVSRRSTATSIGKFLKRVCPDDYPRIVRRRERTNIPYYYDFPPLEQCRDTFNKEELGGGHVWPESEEQGEREPVPF